MSRRGSGSGRWQAAVLSLLLLPVIGVGIALWWLGRPLELAAPTVEVSIEAGTTPRQIADAWVRAGVNTSPRLLYEWFRWSGEARRIRAGSYAVLPGATPRTLLSKMVEGDEQLETVRLIEGRSWREFRAELARAPRLKPTTAAMSDAELMTAIGAPGINPEGRFFPDTYAYSVGVSDLLVLKRAYTKMQQELAAAWAARAPGGVLKTPEQALTLASIVEKETGREADRALVAGVFSNRLRVGMPLQTDPSVIYGLGARFDGNLRRVHLESDGPYNTYTRPGLPPTPIAMPGRASLLAAVKPAPTQALYFVARGDGSSQFSSTLADHNRAVNQYQRGRP
ncbi:endolytic transglycosylase MltG [Rubrivivax gelatinosus]|uniref:Endolytic murein transglycosylase n=1 Tax=Rubrivivax gelatinosus TaxID=28068 RepID=A0ABS1DT24_RUBGE|nr:endolytic transglycosylase MltG [Rubrivivax gelatinosus]MBK1713169.1 aminodeoxychorismate lyase [Rubrivivax gelatinosus]